MFDQFYEHDLELEDLLEDSFFGLFIEFIIFENKKKNFFFPFNPENYYQSESYKITISAVAKLIPNPPALVVNIKMNLSESGLL